MSDLIYARPYQVKDNFGRDWPGEWVPNAVDSFESS
jgi:hypothetical protein